MFFRDLEAAVNTVNKFEFLVEKFVSDVVNDDPSNDYMYSKELAYLINADLRKELDQVLKVIEDVSERSKVESPLWI